MPLNRPEILLDVLEEHLEELDFLCGQRESVLFEPDWTLYDLAELESRMQAHLDGLVVGQDHTADLAFAALAGAERSLATAATLALMALGPEMEQAVVGALPKASPEGALGIRIGLCHSPISRVAAALAALADGQEPIVRAVAIDVLTFHGQAAPTTSLDALLAQPDPAVCCIALGTAARLGLTPGAERVEAGLRSESSDVRNATLRSAAATASPDLLSRCRETDTPETLAFIGVIGSDEDLPLLDRALGNPERATTAAAALGTLGTPAALQRLLTCLRDPSLSREAGAAFTRITGVEITADDAPTPPEGLSEEELDAFEDTPPPDPEKAETFWRVEGARLSSARRWQAGRDVSDDPLGPEFNELPLATRRDLYLGVRATDPSAARLELEARALRQLGGEHLS